MQRFMRCTISLLFIFLNASFAADSTVVSIFDQTLVHFGGGLQNDVERYVEEDNGRVVSRHVTLPTFDTPTSITAHLIVDSKGDPWDRAGTVFLDLPGHENIELLKFITGFGGYSDLSLDISALAPVLQDDCTIKVFIDTWVNPGWVVNFELIYKADDSVHMASWDHGVYYKHTLNRKAVDAGKTVARLNIPDGRERIMLTYYTSGHATDGTGADEFESKYNCIGVDGFDLVRYKPWRDDCRNFRDRNPRSGRWGDTWSSDLSRSGWCPGDIVYPVIFDLTPYLTPGEHELTYWIENIRPQDGSGEGYWRTSSFLTGWGDISTWKPKMMMLSGPDSDAFQTGAEISLRLDLVDALGYTVVKTDETIEFFTEGDNASFSSDRQNWSNPLSVPVRFGSAMVWFKTSRAGLFAVNVRDVAGAIPSPDPLELVVNNYEPDPNERNYALEAIAAEADCECNPTTERAEFAVDGQLATKWCCNNGGSDWLVVSLPDSTWLNYFIVRHAGAGEAPPNDPGAGDNSSQNTSDFHIQIPNPNGGWLDVVTMVANPQTEEGDVSYHLIETPVFTDQVRLLITDPGGDNASRIYEFEMYGRDITKIDLPNFATPTRHNAFYLAQNYPNPFNSTTEIEFFTPQVARVSATIIDSNGRLVKHLFNGQLPQGYHALKWDGTDFTSQSVGSGIYFMNIRYSQANRSSVSKTIKMMHVK